MKVFEPTLRPLREGRYCLRKLLKKNRYLNESSMQQGNYEDDGWQNYTPGGIREAIRETREVNGVNVLAFRRLGDKSVDFYPALSRNNKKSIQERILSCPEER